MARFWAERPAIWTRVARQLCTARGLGEADNARLFAMLSEHGSSGWERRFGGGDESSDEG
jgi:hypothetical protein